MPLKKVLISIVISWCLLSTLTPSDENHRTQNVEKRVRFHLLSMRELSFLKDMMSPDGFSSLDLITLYLLSKSNKSIIKIILLKNKIL